MKRTQRYNSKDTALSKSLSWLLRHGAIEEKLPISPEGYLLVETVLEHRNFKSKCVEADIVRIVGDNDKQRFSLRRNQAGKLEIRANQGHSIKVDALQLTPIQNSSQVKNVIHGTYYKFWPSIKVQGLHRRGRNHIHFAVGLPSSTTVISGARQSAEIFIYINLEKALADGIKFFLSSNEVVLSPGNGEGFMEAKYFLKVVCAKTGNLLTF